MYYSIWFIEGLASIVIICHYKAKASHNVILCCQFYLQ